MKMFWKSESLSNKLTDSNNMNVKKLDEVANKILLLRKFEKDNNIIPFDIVFESTGIKINIKDDEFKYLQTVFRMEKNKPSNKNELQKFYIGILRNIFGHLNIIDSKKTKTKERKDITTYSFNNELNSKLFKLLFKTNSKEVNDTLINLMGFIRPIMPVEADNDFHNGYLFNKRKY